jgi:hypothetical protein
VVVVAPVVVVTADVAVVAGEDDADFFPPPQPATITTKVTAKIDMSLNPIGSRSYNTTELPGCGTRRPWTTVNSNVSH